MNTEELYSGYICLYSPEGEVYYTCSFDTWMKDNEKAIVTVDRTALSCGAGAIPFAIAKTRLEAQTACAEFNRAQTKIVNI